MDVEYATRVPLNEPPGEDAHETCQDNEVGAPPFELLRQRALEHFAAISALPGIRECLETQVASDREPRNSWSIGHNNTDRGIDLLRLTGPCDGHHVGTTPGDQDCELQRGAAPGAHS